MVEEGEAAVQTTNLTFSSVRMYAGWVEATFDALLHDWIMSLHLCVPLALALPIRSAGRG